MSISALSQSNTPNKPEGRAITRPEGIYRLLNRLKSKHSSLGIRFASVADSYTSLVLAVDFKKGCFFLDEVSPQWGDNLMAKAVPFSLVGFYDGCKVTIENLQATGRAIRDGAPVYRIPFPKKLYYLQRREFYRAQIRATLRILVQLGIEIPEQERDEYGNLLGPGEPTWKHQGLLRDLSAQGCQIEISGDVTSLIEANHCYNLCYIIFPSKDQLDLEITVRHLAYDPITKSTSLGCQFTNLDPNLDRQISFIVNELQRDQARTASGNTDAPVPSLFVEAEEIEEAEDEINEEKDAAEENAAAEAAVVKINLEKVCAACIGQVKELVSNLKNRQPLDIAKTMELAKSLVQALQFDREKLLTLTRLRTPANYLYEHSLSVAVLLVDFTLQDSSNPDAKNEEYLTHLAFAGLCHDLGKGLIPEKIFAKAGKLTPAEYKVMHKHSLLTREILSRQQGTPEIALTLATQNCERIDGSGHPEGLTEDAISPLGKIAAILDVFDALTSNRTYQQAVPYAVAYKALLAMPDKLDQGYVRQLIRTQGIYPLGSLVSLSTGEVGFVVSHNPDASPRVLRLVYNRNLQTLIQPKLLELASIKGIKPTLKPDMPTTYALNPRLALLDD